MSIRTRVQKTYACHIQVSLRETVSDNTILFFCRGLVAESRIMSTHAVLYTRRDAIFGSLERENAHGWRERQWLYLVNNKARQTCTRIREQMRNDVNQSVARG